MNTLSLAVRNLLRNRRRSITTLLALAIGSTSVLTFGGYSADIRNTLLTDYVQTGGHIQIQHKDFFLFGNGNPTAYGIAGYDKLMEAIRSDPAIKEEVRVVSPTLEFGGLAGNYEAAVSRTIIGVGYVANDIARMREWNEFNNPMPTPAYKLVGKPDDAVVVGIGLARVLLLCERLGVPDCPRPQASQGPAPQQGNALPADIAALAGGEASAGDRNGPGPREAQVEVLATQPRGSPNVAALKVIAAENQGYKEIDEVLIKLQFSQAQRLVYGRSEPKATSIMVQLNHTAAIPRVAARLREVVQEVLPNQPLAVRDFEQLNPFYRETIQLFNTIFTFVFLIIGGVVLFTVSSAMTAAVVERTTEIGTVRAVGLRRSGIRRLFVAEGFLLGCVGALTGVLCAVALSELINRLGLTWLPPGSSVHLPLTVRVLGEWKMIVGTTIGLIVIATMSAWLPARKASNLSIVDALRHA